MYSQSKKRSVSPKKSSRIGATRNRVGQKSKVVKVKAVPPSLNGAIESLIQSGEVFVEPFEGFSCAPPPVEASDHIRVDDGPEGDDADYTQVKVLVLTFAFTDIPDLTTETEQIVEVFRNLNYDVQQLLIEMGNSWGSLGQKLEEVMNECNPKTLFILYYHGHGGMGPNLSLELVRYVYVYGLFEFEQETAAHSLHKFID
ncbi:hypothetical protein ABW21_db0208114 [Orbilia brochopaga]|nr:hypothetical protein ABW21_db0208114 [Drechslerella brochopaga]